MTQEGVALEVGEQLHEAEIAWPKKVRAWVGWGRIQASEGGNLFGRSVGWQLWVQGKRS